MFIFYIDTNMNYYFNRLVVLMKIVGATQLKDDRTKYTLKIPLASLPQVKPTKRLR